MIRWKMSSGRGPVVAAAVHAGHDRRPEVAALQVATEAERLREEDPHTDGLTELVEPRIVVSTSRFEVDLNRPRRRCVYLVPEHAFGVPLWRGRPRDDVVEAGRRLHDAFYHELESYLDAVAAAHRRFLVLDLHAYCHRRAGPDGPAADPEMNPEVNLGTGTLDRATFGAVADAFLEAASRCEVGGHRLDVRENVRFRGGHFSGWINRRYRGRGCSLALEFKKTFVDEWTGALDEARFAELRLALASTVPALVDALAET